MDKDTEQRLFEIDTRLDKLETPTEQVKQIFAKNSDKFQTNFIKTDMGNGIKIGTELIVKIRNATSVTGKISHNGKLLIIDQSHANDEDKDTETINFILKRKTRFWQRTPNLPPGTYELHLWFWIKSTNEQGKYRDKFEIIA